MIKFQFLSYYNWDLSFWLQRLCMDPIAGKSAHQQRHKCDLRICTSGGPALFKPAKNCPNFSYIFHFCLSPQKLCPFCTQFVLLGRKDHKIILYPVIIATFIGAQDKIWCAIKQQNYYRRMSFNLLRRPWAVKIWSLWPLSYFTSPHCSLCFMFGPPLNYFLPL